MYNSGNATENKVMVSLKDSNVLCNYEPSTILVKQRKGKTNVCKRESRRDFEPESTRTNKIQSNIMVLHNQEPENRHLEPEIIKNEETKISFYDPFQHNEDNSKAFMNSIGSWINDFFNVTNKRPHVSKIDSNLYEQDALVDIDPEYYKSVNAFKEQFKKKLKRETTVNVLWRDKPLEFNFDKVSDQKRKRSRSLPNSLLLETFQDLNEKNITYSIKKQNCQQQKLLESAALGDNKTKHKKHVNSSDSSLLKKKKKEVHNRHKKNEFTYLIPTQAVLTQKMLVNVSDQEKFTQSYKNTHLITQEAQQYGSRKKKSYQAGTRCYMTNANLIENPENCQPKPYMMVKNKSAGCHFYTTDSAASLVSDPHIKKGLQNKNFPDDSRDSSTFFKLKTSKSHMNNQVELSKNESRPSSDELVKYLMKKIKVDHRPQTKKRQIVLAPAIPTNKNRFMQSATNSLVMSVMAKKENENNLPSKINARIASENKLVKVDFMTKPKIGKLRFSDLGSKFDIKKAVAQNKINKNCFILEDIDKLENEEPATKSNYKKLRRPIEEDLKQDMKDSSDRHIKRLEVRNMLSKLDIKNNPFLNENYKQKEEKKNLTKSSALDIFKNPEVKENQYPRFQKQHELFKIDLKNALQSGPPDSTRELEEKEKNLDFTANSLSTELSVINTNLQLLPENTKNELVEVAELDNSYLAPVSEDVDVKVMDLLHVDDKVVNTKDEKMKGHEKQIMSKDKSSKTKSLQFLKDDHSKSILDSVADSSRNNSQSSKDAKVYESAICSTDFRPGKSLDTALLNRRFSTNALEEPAVQKSNVLETEFYELELLDNVSPYDKENSKKEAVEKKKERTPDNSKNEEKGKKDACLGWPFEKTHKPPPNCEDD